MKKIEEFARENWKMIIAIICIIGFLMFAKNVWSKEIMEADITRTQFCSKLSNVRFWNRFC